MGAMTVQIPVTQALEANMAKSFQEALRDALLLQ
jgi:hypothetical protein